MKFFTTTVLILAALCTSAICANYAVRTLPDIYVPGEPLSVSVAVHIDPVNPPNGLILQEITPEGWFINSWSINPPQNQFSNDVDKWTILTPSSFTLNYTVNVPGETSGIYFFLGEMLIMQNEILVSIPTHGNAAISDTDIIQPGDINGDGKVDISDVILCMRMSVGLPIIIGGITYGVQEYPPAAMAAADMNGDGNMTIADVILILRRALDL